MGVLIANREDPDQTVLQKQSDLGPHCFSMPFWQATSVRNFRAFPVPFLKRGYRILKKVAQCID